MTVPRTSSYQLAVLNSSCSGGVQCSLCRNKFSWSAIEWKVKDKQFCADGTKAIKDRQAAKTAIPAAPATPSTVNSFLPPSHSLSHIAVLVRSLHGYLPIRQCFHDEQREEFLSFLRRQTSKKTGGASQGDRSPPESPVHGEVSLEKSEVERGGFLSQVPSHCC